MIVTRVARAAAACGLLVGALLAVAVAPPAARADSVRVSAFGDSVLLGAANAISAALSGHEVSVDAHENLSLLGALSALDAARPAMGDVVVLDFGYNDGPDLEPWRDRIDRAMTILDGVPKVIWFTQSEFTSGRAEMNAELRAAALRYPNLEVVDWNAVVTAHPDFVYGDGVHLTAAGQSAMADAVRGRVDAFVAARIAATSTTLATTTTTSTPVPATVAGRGGRGGARRVTTPRGGTSASNDVWIGSTVSGGLLALLMLLVLLVLVVILAVRRLGPRRVPG